MDDEGLVNESNDATSSVKEKLRPVDMLPTHAGAFQDEENSYNLQLAKPRAQTTMMSYGTQNGGGKRLLNG